jgi:EAL domain-containing protein (putative c-di-GMP-specific phosphodiesterase class I)
VLHQLTALGVGIAIDDFGTGWASLTYLRRFPVHALKIDCSFVSGVDHDAGNLAIVRSILMLGAELGLAVVAEGIETEAEAETLRALGCTLGQGFLYGRATPANQVEVERTLPIAPASMAR